MDNRIAQASAFLHASRPDLAERVLRQELAASPNNALAHAMLGGCLASRRRFKEATDELKEALRLDPSDPAVQYSLAYVLVGRKKYVEAATAIEQALALDPNVPEYWGILAGIRVGQKRWSDAVIAADNGLRLDPTHVSCQAIRTVALVGAGRKKEALATAESALSNHPEEAITHTTRGWAILEQADRRVYLKKGELDKALDHFREALRLDPGYAWARDGYVATLLTRARRVLLGLIAASVPVVLFVLLVLQSPHHAVGIALLVIPGLLALGSDVMLLSVLRFRRDGARFLMREHADPSSIALVCEWIALGCALAWIVERWEVCLYLYLFALAMIRPLTAIVLTESGVPRVFSIGCTTIAVLLMLLGTSVCLETSSSLPDLEIVERLSARPSGYIVLVMGVAFSFLGGFRLQYVGPPHNSAQTTGRTNELG